MASLNKVLLIGNLTRDPELRYTPSGSPVTQLRLAVNRRYRDRDNNWRDDTVFLDVEVWGRQAEQLSGQLHKGSTVFVDGRLKMDEWTSKDGTHRSKLVVVAIWAALLSQPGSGKTYSSDDDQAQDSPPADSTDNDDMVPPEDDEPPF
ncbi:MAG: single-stranded DNA-binding protein [Planctomycetes bacterium]|nr:single-stranded DNA-binding protein [Planctomycetota bacterium]